jgi:ribosomal protein L7Ae-like RNA K-turn-binding protein
VVVLVKDWKLEDITRICCNSRISYTCVRSLEELSTVFNCSVLNSECNKLPLWNRTYANTLQYSN